MKTMKVKKTHTLQQHQQTLGKHLALHRDNVAATREPLQREDFPSPSVVSDADIDNGSVFLRIHVSLIVFMNVVYAQKVVGVLTGDRFTIL